MVYGLWFMEQQQQQAQQEQQQQQQLWVNCVLQLSIPPAVVFLPTACSASANFSHTRGTAKNTVA
jgi:hypothetical protein